MWRLFILIILVLGFIIGSALILLRTAKKPRLPDKRQQIVNNPDNE